MQKINGSEGIISGRKKTNRMCSITEVVTDTSAVLYFAGIANFVY